MRYAAIDIGSNTILLLVAVLEGGRLKSLREEQRVPRLGRGVDRQGRISESSMWRALEALGEYREILEREYPDAAGPAVTATSAARDAANRADFLGRVRERTGYEVRLLSGEEEAGMTFAGAVGMLPGGPEETAVIDIGGGSTEIAFGRQRVERRWSLDMGCVRFTERYLSGDPPGEAELDRCRQAVKEAFEGSPAVRPASGRLVGVAGTATTLAALDGGMERYEPSSVNGRVISLEEAGEWIGRLCALTSRQRESRHPELLRGRADIFPAGLLIMEGYMKYAGFGQVRISAGGLRHGAVLEMAEGDSAGR